MSSSCKGRTYRPGVVALRNSLGVHSFINSEGGVEYDVSDGPGGRRSKVEVTDPILVHRPNHEDEDDDDDDEDDDDFEETELTRGNAKDKITIKSNREAYHRSKHLEIHVRKTVGGWRSSVNSKEPLIPKSKNKTFGSISGSSGYKRIHIRHVSDLERILPPGSSWKRLLLTTVLVLCSAVVYVTVMVAILKGIGGY